MAISKTDSEVEICNLALFKIGQSQQISALGEEGVLGESFEVLYPHTRDYLLASHPWNFAIGRSALTKDANSPAFDYSSQYVLPSDYLRAVRLWNTKEDWRVEGDRLLTDASPANLIYIKRITDVTKFSPLFQELLVTKMAADLALTIKADATKKGLLDREAERMWREAKRRDGQEGTPLGFIADSFTYDKTSNFPQDWAGR